MIIRVNEKTGKKEKISYDVFKNQYKKERYNRIKKDVIKVLQKNYKKLEDTGHGILSASFYINTVGLPEEYVLGHAHKHYSNYNNPKEILYDNNGNVVDYLYGIYNLDILQSICKMIGWHKDKLNLFYSLWGRGSKAEVCIENINLYFENNKK